MINSQGLFNLLFIDIETVPQCEHCDLPAEKAQLFFDKISKSVPENYDDQKIYNQKAGILAEFAKVICISTGYLYTDKAGKQSMKLKSLCNDDEKILLTQFIEMVDKYHAVKPKFQFAGHNIREFDIPFLCRRMIINQIMLPVYLQIHGAKPWEINMVDTLQWWKFGDYKNYTSLHLLANVLGVPSSKDGIDDSMVQHVYYKEKNLKRIVEYCQKDVVVVARVVQRFYNLPILKEEDIFVVN